VPKAYVLLSTYPPTQCGLATFSAALLTHLRGLGDHACVVRVLDEEVPPGSVPRAAPEIVHDLVNGSAWGAAVAVDVINGFDAVIVQHEYGIYGGPDGQDLVPLLNALRVPSIVVLHTVLAQPTARQRAILDDIIASASAVVTMTRTARTRVLDIYGTDPAKVVVIPHGATSYRAPATLRETGKPPVVLTWGLLGPGKGIEHAIDAIALLRDRGMNVAYTIAGQTHPRVQARDGEVYRGSLMARAKGHGLEHLVRFDGRFLPAGALGDLIAGADVVVLPYDSLEQVTSGVLIEAITAGKPVISTSFPHAIEVLGGGAGLLVERQEPAAIASALHRVLTEKGLSARMSRHAGELAPQLLWPAVARRYQALVTSVARSRSGVVA
jgi:glycosyltransferase involved in cell wall biosynthesis